MALSDITSPFVWGSGGEKLTPEQLAARRKVEEALMAQGLDFSPVHHPLQGLARVAGAAAGAYRRNRLDQAEGRSAAHSRSVGSQLMSAVFGGGASNTFPARPPSPGGMLAPQGVGTSPGAAQRNTGSTIDFARAAAPSPQMAAGEWIKYANSGATRNQPINQKLASALGFLPDMGVTMEVFSGGQPGKGSGLARVGSTRHDHGNAADVFFSKDGRRLNWANEQDRPIFQEIVRRAKAAGVTGFGAGPGYMQPGSMHIGFGSPGVWGAGGSGRNAPGWLTEAYNGPAAAPPAQAALESMAVGQSMPMQPTGMGLPSSPPVPQSAPAMQPPGQAMMPREEMSGNVDIAQAAPDMGQAFSDAMFDPYVSPQVRKVAEALFEQQMRQRDPAYRLDMDYKRAQIAKMQQEAAGGGPTEYGLNPQYGVDANNNPVLIQLGKDGRGIQTQMPEGVTLSKEPIKLDAGTHFVLLDPISRQPVGQIPKENYQSAFDTASGTEDAKTAADNRAGLPKVEQQADIMLSTIDNLLSHPGLSSAVGWQGQFPDWTIPAGTDAAGFMSVLDQIGGQAFLQAFESLKGGGQITEVEGTKATNAISRLRRDLSEAEFKKAANELREVVQTGLDRARRAAGVDAGGGSGNGWQDVGGGVRIRRLD